MDGMHYFAGIDQPHQVVVDSYNIIKSLQWESGPVLKIVLQKWSETCRNAKEMSRV